MAGPGSRASSAGPNAAGEATGSARDERTSLGSGPGLPRGAKSDTKPARQSGWGERDARHALSAPPRCLLRRVRGTQGLPSPTPSCRGRRGARFGGSPEPGRRARPGAVGARGSSKLASGSGGGVVGAPFALPAGRVRPVPGTTVELLRETGAFGEPRPAAPCGRGHFPPVATRDHRLRALARGTGLPRPGRTWVAADACRAARRFPADRLGELPPLRAGRGRSPMVHGIAGFVAWARSRDGLRVTWGAGIGSAVVRARDGWGTDASSPNARAGAAESARSAAGRGIRTAGLGRVRPLGRDCGGRTEASLATRGGA